MNYKTRAKCYTFYSYKGGSGRTTTAINTIKHLVEYLGATAEKPVLLIDADLESAGLTYFLDCDKKFSSMFDESVHTNKIFGSEDSFVCDNISGRRLFGIANEVTSEIPEETLFQMSKIYGNENESVVGEVLRGLKLAHPMLGMLQKIVAAVYYMDQPNGGESKNREIYFKICSVYNKSDINDLIRNLIKANAESVFDRERREKKLVLFQEFLPAVGFVDVSEYFGCEPGVVKFLGVDVRYEEEQVLRNGREEVIQSFLRECGDKKYSAVVFDCGAGVQSSAHILHSVSDVLVYCLRPAVQFLKGTTQQLDRYKKRLSDLCSLKDEGKKNVILLPTAVPISDESNVFGSYRIGKIKARALAYDFTDTTFCTTETCLNEVELFKWNECVLGVNMPYSAIEKETTSEAVFNQLKKYTDIENMPYDAKKAYDTYNLLAKKLIENT